LLGWGNIPIVQAKELRMDNLFELEDGSVAILDYESEYNEANFTKYGRYLMDVIDRYLKEGKQRMEKIAELGKQNAKHYIKEKYGFFPEIDDVQIALNADNLLITMQGKEGFAFAGTGTLGVVLDTTITEELKEEGYVRELISKIQNMRKDKGFEVLDRITLYVNGNKDLENIIEKNKQEIKKETLTIEIVYNAERKEYTECNINGEKINIDVEVIKK